MIPGNDVGEVSNDITTPRGEPTGEAPLEIVRENIHPDTVAVHVGRVLAGAAIEDHFHDVVMPTVQRAQERYRKIVRTDVEKELRESKDRLLSEADEAIYKKRQEMLTEAEKLVTDRVKGELAGVVEPILESMISEVVKKSIKPGAGLTIELYDPATERITTLSRQHYMFPALLRLLCVRDRNGQPLNIAVVGPAGNGKTSMALCCAEALGIEAVLQPFNPQTTKSDLLGYMSADGHYVPSPFYEAFTKGKIFIADEFDAANPSIAVTLNAAVANRTLTFPNLETAHAHPNFRAVFIMNTSGGGADHQYTGRMRQDAASLDRMVYLGVPIDRGLEAAIAGVEEQSQTIQLDSGGLFESNHQILSVVQSVRAAIEELGMKYIISPRATLHATAMHAGGFGKDWIMECCIWRGMPQTDKVLINRTAGL
jgi:vacuolar-type H+-ATPase subunit H